MCIYVYDLCVCYQVKYNSNKSPACVTSDLLSKVNVSPMKCE